MRKIKVKSTLVEIDGDEMARVIWHAIRELLILPYLDIDLDYFDLGIESRDQSDDRITLAAVEATRREGIAVKCATITPDESRVREFNLKKMWRSPNLALRDSLDGTLFREPIICPNVPRIVPHWNQPVVIARHGFGDHSNATDFTFAGAGILKISFTPKDGGAPIEREVFNAPGAGIAMAMINLDESIRGFARASFNYALTRRLPVFLSTKNTIIKIYDGRFKDLFEEVFNAEFREKFRTANLGYEHRLIDDMVASSLKWNGGYLWACKNYDGDVQADAIAQGFGSLGLMTSVVTSPDGRTLVSEAAHGTVTRHYRQHLLGLPTSTNPIASIFAWTRGLRARGERDGTAKVVEFSALLESICLETVACGKMTKDLANLINPDHPYLNTDEFLQNIAVNLSRRIREL
ncbi:MAG: NADP-dependent isocitrate dehydrogenase [Burkholderiales bacterium]